MYLKQMGGYCCHWGWDREADWPACPAWTDGKLARRDRRLAAKRRKRAQGGEDRTTGLQDNGTTKHEN